MSRVRAYPLTLTYLLLLIAATVAVRSLPPETQAALMRSSSTDVVHLLHTPTRVLVASAFWLPTTDWLVWLGLLLVVLGSLERRVGLRRSFQIFVSGHVLATLATELPIAGMIHVHLLAGSAAERSDVGVSYGFFASVGALAGLLSRRSRFTTLAAGGGYMIFSLICHHDMTTIGHVLSLGCGIAWWPALHRHRAPSISDAREGEDQPAERTASYGSYAAARWSPPSSPVLATTSVRKSWAPSGRHSS